MALQDASSKHIMALEQQITELLKTMRKAKIQTLPIYEALQALEKELGEARRKRFDGDTPEYKGF